VWPSETVTIFAILVGVQLLVSGLFRIVMAIGARGIDGGLRVLLGLTGGLALVVGLLCLRDPVQTLLYLSILLGIWCLLAGVVDVVAAVISSVPGRRAFDLVTGLVNVAIGVFLLVNPTLSLTVLVVAICALLFLMGAVAVVTAVLMRRSDHVGSTASAGTAVPAV
jgi:uncharacterized membrane protein HdeD (DUF308 family)